MTFAEFLVRALAAGIHDLFNTGILRAILSGGVGEVGKAVAIGGGFVLCIIASYLLGSVNFALIISKCFFRDDVREHGSGNAGTTNVLRTYGKKAAIWTFVGDALKGVVAILIAAIWFGAPDTEPNYLYLVTAVYLAAFFCVLGHVFPIFSRFRGGKGFATMVGIILALNPAIFLILFIIYVPLILCSHYISLSSVVMALFWPLILSVVDRTITGYGIHVLFAVCIGVLITWAHRGNLKRIFDGNERKFYPFRKKTPAVSATPAEESTEEGGGSEE